MSKPYHVYLDLDVVNNDTTPNQKAPQLSFEETRSQPFLDGTADDYFVAIARFSIQTGGTLPVFIPAIQTGQDDIDLTVYRITIDYNGSTGYADIRHVAQPTADNAASPMNGQDFSGNHYYVYNYSDWIQMVNTGFTAAVKDLQNKLIAASTASSPTPLTAFTAQGSANGSAVPFMMIDLQALTCVLNVDLNWYDSSATGKAAVYFNTRLYELFVGFPFKFLGYTGDKNYQIPISNVSSSNILTTSLNGTSTKYLQAFQEVSTVGLWNPVSSIVFTSTTLPIHPTLTSQPKVYNSSSNGMRGSGACNLSNTLTDFEIAISSTNSYRPEISYAPQGEYRLIDMYSNSNLNKIDLNVYWKDKYGNLKPLRLQPGCSASVKILFRHKHFYLGYE